MLRKTLLLCGGGVLLTLGGCAVLQLLMLPFEFVLSILGVLWDGAASAVDAVVLVEPVEGTPPVVERMDDGRLLVTGIAPGVRFDLVVSAPGHEERRFRFPADVSELRTGSDGRAELSCLLFPLPPASDR